MSVKIGEDIKAKYEDLAKSYGLPVSTIAAFILGQWITDRKLEPLEHIAGLTADN
jgi:antitoxin component of RelBE/YafQ-DinJ toxin-antitoxin module